MKWSLIIGKHATKTLAKLDEKERTRILKFLKVDLLSLDNPRQLGKALTGQFKGMWRYRVGDYRILCEIVDNELVTHLTQNY